LRSIGLIDKIFVVEADFNSTCKELKSVSCEYSQLKERFQKVSEEKELIAKELQCSTEVMESRMCEYENIISSKDSTLESIQQAHEELFDDHSKLLDDATKLKMSLNSLDEENQYCKEIITQLEQAEAERNKQIDQLHASNKNLIKKSELLHADLNEKQVVIDQLKNAKSEDSKSLEHFKNLCHKSQNDFENLKLEFQTATQTIKNLNDEKEELIATNLKLNEKYKIAVETQCSFEELKEEISNLKDSNSALQSNLSCLQIQLQEESSKNSSLSESVVNSENLVSTLRDQLDSERMKHEEAIRKLTDTAAECNESKDKILSEYEVIKQTLETIAKEKMRMEELAASRLSNVNNYKHQVESFIVELNNACQDNELIQNKLNQSIGHNHLLQQNLNDKVAELSKETQEKNKAINKLKEIEVRFVDVSKRLDDKENLITEIESNSLLLQRKLDSQAREIVDMVNDHEKSLMLLNKTLIEAEEKKSSLQSQLNTTESKLTVAIETVEKLRLLIDDDLSPKLAESNKSIVELI